MKNAPNQRFALSVLALLHAALFIASPGTAAQPSAQSGTPTPLAEELKPLQGDWEGDGAGGKCSISIAGNSLHYRNSAGWYKTIFTLPAGTNPHQLHATIKECSPPSDSAIGTVVLAIFKIEDGTLTLAVDGDEPPKTFFAASSLYVLKKVQPQKKTTEPPKTK